MNAKYILACVILASIAIACAKEKPTLSQKLVGHKAPLFKAQAVYPDGSVQTVDLKKMIGKKIAISFYPMDNSPRCTVQAKKFRDEFARLADKNIALLGVSKDSIRSHTKFSQALALPYPLVCDAGGRDSIFKKYKADRFLFGKRVTFLIDEQGVVFKVFDHIDITTQVDDILQAFADHQ